jgi:hypothetical protein
VKERKNEAVKGLGNQVVVARRVAPRAARFGKVDAGLWSVAMLRIDRTVDQHQFGALDGRTASGTPTALVAAR